VLKQNSHKVMLVFTVLAVVMLLSTVAYAQADEVIVPPGGEVVIGFASGLSGEGIAPLGLDIQRGAELAVEDRPVVTVDGVEFSVVLDVQDDMCSAEGGQATANRFVADDTVVGVVGSMCSSSCFAAAPIYEAAGYSNISPSCTAPGLTLQGWQSFNRTVLSDGFQGALAAEFIYNELGITRIATVHDGSPYGEGLVEVVTMNFEALGGEVVASDAVVVGSTDFRSLLDDFAMADPELIYFGGFPAEAARLIQQRADVGLEDVLFMGADGIEGTEVVSLAGGASEGIYASAPIPAASDALEDFLERYIDTYGEEPPAPFHANSYDAANILLDAIEAVGVLDDDGNLVISRQALSEYIRSISNYQGLTGVLNADGTGETSAADVGFFQVQDGEFVQVAVLAGAPDDEDEDDEEDDE
jgi:branched-chain amino acid transport system substrate-binding protein